jgi:glycosyltransferase involved in cell wall biosynthesis
MPDIALVNGLHDKGIEVDVMIPPESTYVRLFAARGIRVLPCHPARKFSIRSICRIRREIQIRKYHIIHLFNTKAIVNGSFAAIGLRVKVVAYRGAAGMYWYDPTAWLSHLNPRVDKIICNSQYVQRHMQKQLILRSNKTIMIHKGMDLQWFERVVPLMRSRLNIPESAILVGCVANVRRVKGVHFLLEATKFINPSAPVHILLIGSGMDSPEYRRIINESPLRNHIHLTGYRKDVYEIIASCDIYIQPSLSESLSRSVMEAMSLGVPCIVTDTGGLVELVDNNASGLVVQKANSGAIANAIEKLASNPGLRKEFGRVGKDRMRDIFSVDRMVNKTWELYHDLI